MGHWPNESSVNGGIGGVIGEWGYWLNNHFSFAIEINNLVRRSWGAMLSDVLHCLR